MAYRKDDDDLKGKKSSGSSGNSEEKKVTPANGSGKARSSSTSGKMTMEEFRSKTGNDSVWNWQSFGANGAKDSAGRAHGNLNNTTTNTPALNSLLKYQRQQIASGATVNTGLFPSNPTRGSSEYNRQQTQSQPRAGSSSAPEKQTAQQKLQEKTSPFGIEGISGIPDINSDNWYAGDAPNDIDMFARAVAKGGTGDSDLMSQLWGQRYSKDSANYRPYSMATSTALQQLANLGVEVPMSGFSSERIQEMLNATAPYYKPGKNSTSGAPTLSRASKEEKIAYWVYQLANDDETTTKAETELNALREEIGYLANSPKNYSDEEILSRISFDKYKTLKKLQEDYGEDRVPVQLTRTVDFSSDYLPGMIWAARNGIQTDSAFEAAVYARANNYRGGYTRDEEISAKLDPNDDRYNPYAVGATMDDAGIYYGEYTWDDNWLQEHRADRESPDATRRKNYTAVYKANEFTKSCETELQQLNTAIEEYFDGGWADLTMAEEGQDLATTILTQLMEDGYSNLKTIDETIASGSFRDTTRPIDYKFNQKVDEIRARLEQKAAEPEPKEKMDRHIGILEGVSQGFGGIVSGIRDFFTPEPAVVPDGSMNPEPRTDKDGNIVTPSPSKSGVKPGMSRAEEKGVRVASAVTSDVGSNAYFKTPRPDTTPSPEDGVGSRAQEEIDKAKSDTLQQAGTVIRESGTEEEKQIYKYTGPNAEKNVQQIYDAIQNGEMTAEQGRDELTGAADMYARENLFSAKVTVHDFERLSLAIADKQARLAEMPEPQPGTSEADVQRKEAMLLEAMQTGNMELYDQAQAIGNLDPEAEMLAVRRDALEREIAEDQARLDQMRTEVDRANRVIGDAQHLYDMADAAAGVTGQEPSDALRANEIIDALMAFDTYTTPDWAAYSIYDIMLNEGADYDAVAKDAADTAQKYRQAAERITVTLKAAEQMGIAIPDDYAADIESARDYYLNGALDGEYLQLRGKEDFRSVADAERAKAKENPDPTGIIDRMMADPVKYGKVDLTFVDPIAQLEQRMAAESRNFTEAERDTYFYLLGTSGKEAADAYYRHLSDNTYGRINARIADEMMADARAKAAENGWSAAIETAKTSLLSPVANISAASQVVINRLTGTKTNPYMAGFLPQLTAAATRDEAKTMAMNAAGGADSLGGKFAGFWFDAAVSAADSTVNALVSSAAGLPSIGGKFVGGIAGSSIMGLGAGASAYRDVIEKGGREDQALLMGAVSFAAETVTEAIELQDILDAAGIGAAAGEEAGKTFLAYMKKQIPELRNEFFGEALGQAIEGVAEDKILDALSDRRKRIDEAVANGEMLEGAQREADMNFWKDVLGAGVMGAASTGLSTSVAYGAGSLRGAITGTPADGTETRQNGPQTENGEILTQTEETQGNENQSEPDAQTQPEANLEQPEENLAPQTQPEAQPEAQAEPESIAPIAEEDARARFMRQMVNLQQAAASSDTRIQTTALTSFLETGMDETADDLTFGQASAAAQGLMKKLGGLRAARMLQDIITVEAARQGDTAGALEAIRVGAALDGGEVEALAEGPVTAEQLDAFRARMQEAMNRPEVQEAMRRQAHDALVTNETRKLVEDGALKESVDKKRNADKAKKKAQRSSDELKKAVNAVGAAEENYRQSNELFLNDPTNPQLQADVREKGRKLEGAITVQEEYRQSNDNAQEASAQAQTEYRERSAEQLKALREQAEERARAVEEAAQEKRAAIRQRQNLQAQAVRGNDGRTYVNATTPIQFHYAAIDVGGLITSNDENMNVNPDYPQALQPRDRTRLASRTQTETMSRTLNPELLGSDSSVTGGAPIVGPDYIVESGNQRTMAIRQAMNQGTSEGYTTWLREHAADFGLDPAGITDRTVLVRVRDTEVDRAEFARQANESVTAQMSPAELAQSDAAQLSEDVLALFQQTENGEIDTGANRPFLKAFLQSIIPESQQGAYTQENGRLSKQGIDRIRNALFQRAYGSTRLTTAFSEATDETSRNVFTALMNAAPHMAAVSDAIQRGTMYAVQIADDVAQAAELIRQVRSEGGTLDERLNQFSIFGDVDPVVADFARMMDEYKRSGKNMTRALNDVLDTIENLGAPNQETLPGFEIPAPDKQALVEASLERTRERIAAERAGAVEGQIGLPGMDAQAFTETAEDSNTVEPGPEKMRTPETQEAIDERRARYEAEGITTDDEGYPTSYIQVGPQHTDEQAAIIHEYQEAVNPDILKAYKEYLDGDRSKGSGTHIGTEVSQRTASRLKELYGFDATGYHHAIGSVFFQHEAQNHTSRGAHHHDVSMENPNDVARIEWVIEHYDTLEPAITKNGGQQKYSRDFTDKQSKPNPEVVYTKQIDGTIYVAEAVGEVRNQRLNIISAYIKKSPASQQSKSAMQSPHGSNTTPSMDAQSANATPTSNQNVPQTDLTVNSGIEGFEKEKRQIESVQAFQGTGQQAQRPIQPVQVPTGKPKYSPQQIASRLAKSLNIGNFIGTRKMNGMPANVQGYFEKHAEYIAVRSKNAGDYVTTMHELGHAIGKRLGMTGTQDMITAMQQNAAASGIDLSKYTPNQLQDEAYAEFFWRYMEDEDLARQFAGDAFVDDFERQMQNAGIDRMVHRSAGELRQYVNATANDRIAALVHDKSEKRKTPLSDRIRHIIAANVDATSAAERVLHEIRKQTGKMDVAYDVDIRSKALLKNFAGRRAANIIESRWGGALAGAGLKGKEGLDLLSRYMLVKHSFARDQQGKPVFEMTLTEAQRRQFIRDVERTHPEVQRAAAATTQFWQDFIQEYLVDTGRLDQATFDEWKQTYPDYVPTFRFKEGSATGGGHKQTASGFQIRAAKGSTEDIINPIDSMCDMINTIVAQKMANDAALAWHNAAQTYEGLGVFGRQITPDMVESTVDTRGLQNAVRKMLDGNTTDDVIQAVIDEIGEQQTQWRSMKGSTLPNVLTVQLADGSQAYYEMLDADLFKLLAAQPDTNGDALGMLTKTFGRVTRSMSALTTGSNPVFATRNFMRDFQTSVNYGSWASNYVTGAAKWLMAAYDVWTGTGKKGPSGKYADYIALGGGGWTRIDTNHKNSAEELRGKLVEGYDTSGAGRKAKKAASKIWETLTLDRINEVVEQTSRYAEYKFGKHDTTTQEGREEAFLAAQEATVDFARSGNGNLTQTLKQIIPFFGASMQGVYRTGRMLTEAERSRLPARFAKTVLNTALTSALASAVLLKFLDDDDKEAFENMSDDLKSQHFYLPNFVPEVLGKQPLIRIPLAQDPLTYAVHGIVTNAAWKGTTDQDIIDLLTVANTIVDNLAFFNGGTVLEPILGVGKNRNWYGSKIVPTRLENVPASSQYTKDTPDVFIAAGRALGMSPLNVQYLAEQYTGFLGQMAIPALSKDKNTGELGGWKAAIAAAQKRLTSDPLVSNEAVGAFYDGYSLIESMNTTAKNGLPLNELRRGLTPAQAQRAVNEAYKLTHKGGILYRTKQNITDYYAQIDKINANRTLSDEEKYEMTSKVRRRMVREALIANETIQAYRERYVTGDNIAERALFEGAFAKPAK